jgi:predicted transcriptional regulator
MDDTEMTKLTAQVVEAFASGNRLSATDLPALIATVHQALLGAGAPPQAAADEVKKLTPARIRQSIKPDHLISFEDGQPYKMLKRHLTGRGLTPTQYRQKWGLPADYPMTAPGYSEQRSALAKAAGLGQKTLKPAPAEPPPAAAPQASKPAPKPKQSRKPRVATKAAGASAADKAR